MVAVVVVGAEVVVAAEKGGLEVLGDLVRLGQQGLLVAWVALEAWLVAWMGWQVVVVVRLACLVVAAGRVVAGAAWVAASALEALAGWVGVHLVWQVVAAVEEG